MNNWKKLAAAVILAGAVVMIQGCGGNGEEAKSMEKGRVWKAATEAAYPPFRYVDENRNLVGFEVDLLKEIGRRTGATIEFRDMPFDRLLDAVAGKQVEHGHRGYHSDERKRETGGLFRLLLPAERILSPCKKRKSTGAE